MNPLLSIIVPTKDRYIYLKPLIHLIDSFKLNYIELIIQDNTEQNAEILAFIKANKFNFIKYFHKKKPMPISDSSDLAILNSSGEYVCFIGDDDGVTRHIGECVKWMKKNYVDVVVPKNISYHWPDYFNSSYAKLSSTLSVRKFTKKYSVKNPINSLKELMKKGFTGRGQLPLLYHGIVKRSLLDEIYNIGGTYFPGASPDIANGVALSFLSKKYIQLDFPIIISGASAYHGGGIKRMKNKSAEIDKMSFLPKNAKQNWEKNIPLIWTGGTVWPESAIKALRYMGKQKMIKEINFEYMLGRFMTFNFHYRKMAIELSKNKISLIYYFISTTIIRYLKALTNRATIVLFKVRDGSKFIDNINDIRAAEQFLNDKNPYFRVKK